MGSIGGNTERGYNESTVQYNAYDFERYHMSSNQTSVSNVQIQKVENIKGDEADVTYSYDANLRIVTGIDPETGREEVEYDTEYRTATNRLKIR